MEENLLNSWSKSNEEFKNVVSSFSFANNDIDVMLNDTVNRLVDLRDECKAVEAKFYSSFGIPVTWNDDKVSDSDWKAAATSFNEKVGDIFSNMSWIKKLSGSATREFIETLTYSKKGEEEVTRVNKSQLQDMVKYSQTKESKASKDEWICIQDSFSTNAKSIKNALDRSNGIKVYSGTDALKKGITITLDNKDYVNAKDFTKWVKDRSVLAIEDALKDGKTLEELTAPQLGNIMKKIVAGRFGKDSTGNTQIVVSNLFEDNSSSTNVKKFITSMTDYFVDYTGFSLESAIKSDDPLQLSFYLTMKYSDAKTTSSVDIANANEIIRAGLIKYLGLRDSRDISAFNAGFREIINAYEGSFFQGANKNGVTGILGELSNAILFYSLGLEGVHNKLNTDKSLQRTMFAYVGEEGVGAANKQASSDFIIRLASGLEVGVQTKNTLLELVNKESHSINFYDASLKNYLTLNLNNRLEIQEILYYYTNLFYNPNKLESMENIEHIISVILKSTSDKLIHLGIVDRTIKEEQKYLNNFYWLGGRYFIPSSLILSILIDGLRKNIGSEIGIENNFFISKNLLEEDIVSNENDNEKAQKRKQRLQNLLVYNSEEGTEQDNATFNLLSEQINLKAKFKFELEKIRQELGSIG